MKGSAAFMPLQAPKFLEDRTLKRHQCRAPKTDFICLLLLVSFSLLIARIQAGTIVYTHDAAGRLTGASHDAGKFIGYTYDNAGNLTLRQLVVIGIGDSDGDGMDDTWELDYFQTLARDGTGDFDADGMTDLNEFRAGTLPDDPNSGLRILPNPTVAGGAVTVPWQSVPGKTYRLQFKNSLADADWTDVPGDVSAVGATASKTDTTATGLSGRFYRVRLLR
jgi:YD repeat-containing protein